MTFKELFASVKKKFLEHPEIVIDRERLSVNITDIFGNSFYILWDNNKISVEPFEYRDNDVHIIASQHDLILLFTERQYLFATNQELNIRGSFDDVMAFQRILSYITKDNFYVVQAETSINWPFPIWKSGNCLYGRFKNGFGKHPVRMRQNWMYSVKHFQVEMQSALNSC